MKNIITLIVFFISANIFPQNNLHKKTKDILKLYIKDILKRKFNDGDYIAVSAYANELYIETLSKDFELFRHTKTYKWFKFKGKEIIIFCDFNSDSECKKYLNRLNLKNFYSDKKMLDTEPISDKLDGEIRLWSVFFDNDSKVNRVNGKIIEAEIANPKGFTKFLRNYSKLLLYQMDENGDIVYPNPFKKKIDDKISE